jgi:multidrug efflux pump subunit AcrB
MLFLLLAGVLVGLTIKLEVFPETSLDRINITTIYPNASPAEVEEAVIRKIEENVAGLAGIKRIDSVAGEGLGSVTIQITEGWDIKTLLDEVKAEVGRIMTFPEEAEEPIVREVTRRSEVIYVVLYGDAPEWTIKHLAEKIEDDITNLEGVTLADLLGVRTGEIHIEISEQTLRRYGLTLGKISEMVRNASLDLPAGSVKTEGGEILIRTKGRRYNASDYGDVAVITRADGTKVTLNQIAQLKEGFEDVDLFSLFQGKPAAMIQVFRVADQNALNVADRVKKYIEEIRPGLPAGLDIAYFADMSKILRSRLELLLKNMAIGFLLVIFLLAVFLNVRLAFWVTLGIPISFMAGLMLLPQFDISINMISLFAFIMVLGIVVDDAIIIGENIYRRCEEGLSPLKGAIEGALEVGRPVIFSVLTTIVAFWPLLLGGGFMGRIMRHIPIVIVFVLLGSLVESLFILPAHLARSRGTKLDRKKKREKIAARGLKWFIRGPYSRLVDFCVRWRYATVAFAITVLMLTVGMWVAGWVKFTFMHKLEGDVLQCLVTMPTGTPVQRTLEVVTAIERAGKEAMDALEEGRPEGSPPLLQHSVALVGSQMDPMSGSGSAGGHLAQIWLELLEGEKRDISAAKLVQLWREKAGIIPDAESIRFTSEMMSAGSPIEVHISFDNHEQLLAAARELEEELKGFPGVYDIRDNFLPGKKEMQLKLKPAARSLGLTLNDLARQVRHAFYGAEALRLQRDKDEVKVLVRYPDAERRSLGSMEEMRIRTLDGSEVPFSQVALVDQEQGYFNIERAQRRRVVKVTANLDETLSSANEVRGILERRFLPQLKSRYPGLRYTIEGEGKEQKDSFQDILQGFAVALFGIYALLAIPFKSFTQPFIIMGAIPFGLVGAVVGHMIMGIELSFVSLFGMVGLTGVVVNDSLVMIYAANRFRDQGQSAHKAATKAAQLRFRAIILTSLTTFAGLTPIILEKSFQAKILIPMAVSLGFGVLFATFVTLLLIPCGYVILTDIKNLLGTEKTGPVLMAEPEGR